MNMRVERDVRTTRLSRKVAAIGVAGILGAIMFMPVAMAGNTRSEERVSHERVINHAKVESLQRWVSAGHADWCKDARVVAAEELWRLAPDYSGDGFDLAALVARETAGKRVTFEWAPLDGRTLYRVTVERCDWLLPIAKNAESIVWVPTSTEILTQE
jgi:hypothetical protein